MAQCSARSKRTSKRCRRPAVGGTDKCRFHGGLTPIKHGLFSKWTRGRLAGLIEANRTDPKLTDIREHLALLAALSQDLLARKDSGRLTMREREALAKLAERGIDGVKKLTEVEKGILHTVRIETFQAFVQKAQEIILKGVDDVLREHPDLRARLLAELATRLGTLGPSAAGPGPQPGAAAGA